jgi:hypothetical protein
MEKSVNIRICLTQNVQDTEFSDNFIIINDVYLFNSTEWCYIKCTTDNVLQSLLQASRWRVNMANTILQ